MRLRVLLPTDLSSLRCKGRQVCSSNYSREEQRDFMSSQTRFLQWGIQRAHPLFCRSVCAISHTRPSRNIEGRAGQNCQRGSHPMRTSLIAMPPVCMIQDKSKMWVKTSQSIRTTTVGGLKRIGTTIMISPKMVSPQSCSKVISELNKITIKISFSNLKSDQIYMGFWGFGVLGFWNFFQFIWMIHLAKIQLILMF